jgi:hypothetical protein
MGSGADFAFLGFVAVALCSHLVSAEPASDRLRLEQKIALPGVEGRLDHLDCDAANQRLFVCALGNNSLEIIDLQKGARFRSITGLGAPQGVAYVAQSNRLLIASDEKGLCRIYDAKSWQLIATVDFKDDADNARYDPVRKEILVGFGSGGLGIIDAEKVKRTGTIPLAAHPEAFAAETKGSRIFLNVPEAGHVAVVDRAKGAVTATWQTGAAANFPMALDEANARLFVGCRKPASLVVLDTSTGKIVSRLTIAGDADDIFYDANRRRLYAVCGEGKIELIDQIDPDHYKTAAAVPTAAGARTGLFVPELNSLFVAVPRSGSREAEIRRYSVE